MWEINFAHFSVSCNSFTLIKIDNPTNEIKIIVNMGIANIGSPMINIRISLHHICIFKSSWIFLESHHISNQKSFKSNAADCSLKNNELDPSSISKIVFDELSSSENISLNKFFSYSGQFFGSFFNFLSENSEVIELSVLLICIYFSEAHL
jgi:hypothetical protein